jgi:hypothetical protein
MLVTLLFNKGIEIPRIGASVSFYNFVVKVKVVPFPTSEVTEIVPSIFSTIYLEIMSPNPMPLLFLF